MDLTSLAGLLAQKYNGKSKAGNLYARTVHLREQMPVECSADILEFGDNLLVKGMRGRGGVIRSSNSKVCEMISRPSHMSITKAQDDMYRGQPHGNLQDGRPHDALGKRGNR